jgi:tol-pal system protein YbgF
MQSVRAVLVSFAMVSMVGCASQADLQSVRRDSDETKSRIFAIEKGLGEVRGEVKEGVEKSLAGHRERLEALQKEVEGYQKDMASIRKGGADLQATLDSARVDMQLLTGKVDDLRIQAQKPADDLALLKEDTSKRLALLEDRLTKLEQGLAGMAEQQKKSAELQQQTPEALYQQGLDAMKGGDSGKARELFTKFLDQNPKHKLAANAHYWLGETYYSEKNFEQAILEFQEVIKNFPEKDKVPAAMLKQGMAFKEMGDSKSSLYIYKKLTEEYPKSEEAKIAKEKLRTK